MQLQLCCPFATHEEWEQGIQLINSILGNMSMTAAAGNQAVPTCSGAAIISVMGRRSSTASAEEVLNFEALLAQGQH
jgi:hypothetical protein